MLLPTFLEGWAHEQHMLDCYNSYHGMVAFMNMNILRIKQ
jgi:hypothetical protein